MAVKGEYTLPDFIQPTRLNRKHTGSVSPGHVQPTPAVMTPQTITDPPITVSTGDSSTATLACSSTVVLHMHSTKFQLLVKHIESNNWVDFWNSYYASKTMRSDTISKILKIIGEVSVYDPLNPSKGVWFKELFKSDRVLREVRKQLLKATTSPFIAMVGDNITFYCQIGLSCFTLSFVCSYE